MKETDRCFRAKIRVEMCRNSVFRDYNGNKPYSTVFIVYIKTEKIGGMDAGTETDC